LQNCAVTVFDLYQKKHIFSSYNFPSLLGYDMSAIEKQGNEYFDSRIHPDDFATLMLCSIDALKLYFNLPPDKKDHFKLVNEYRVRGRDENYIRVIEQHQTLLTDPSGNLWLSLGVIDISPDQSDRQGVRSRIFNHQTGETTAINLPQHLSSNLTKRESEVFHFVRKGLLSKEISEKLSISVHTVNTHRQRILGKLNANNSMEAAAFAARHGLT
jgi:DNA-binding CsgD family transcriptional regulator